MVKFHIKYYTNVQIIQIYMIYKYYRMISKGSFSYNPLQVSSATYQTLVKKCFCPHHNSQIFVYTEITVNYCT